MKRHGLGDHFNLSDRDRPAFEARLATARPNDVLLEVGDYHLSLEDFSRLLERDRATAGTVPVLPGLQRAWERYEGLAQEQLLYHRALASGFTDEPAYRRLIDERVRRMISAERMPIACAASR